MLGWHLERLYVFFVFRKATVLLADIFTFYYSVVSVMRSIRLQAHISSYLTPP